MDLKIVLKSMPNHLSASTLSVLVNKFIHEIEKSVYEIMCEMNKTTSRNQIQKSIFGNVHLDVDKVEKGSFILYLTGALTATIASCLYDVVKKNVVPTREGIESEVIKYSPKIAKEIEVRLKKAKRFGSLYVSDVKVETSRENKFLSMNINVDLDVPKDKEHMPTNSESQIDFILLRIREKRNRGGNKDVR